MYRVRTGGAFERLAAYSRAARVHDIVAVSATAAVDDTGVALHPGDAQAQTHVAFQRALEAAAQLGAQREDVLRTRIYLAPGVDWRGPVEAHRTHFAGVDPANTTLHVGALIPTGCLVEVELDAIASRPASG